MRNTRMKASHEHDAPMRAPALPQDPPGQALLAEAISTALRKDRHLVVEAPDNPAYTEIWLSPLLHDALAGQGQVLIVTATLERRQRLVEQELPRLTGPSDQPVSVALLQRLDSYACPEKLTMADDLASSLHAPPQAPAFWTLDELAQLRALNTWLHDGGSGLLSDAPTPLTPRARAFSAVSDAQCLGEVCPFVEGCAGRNARRMAQEATVLLMDYATLCATYLKDPRTEPAAPDLGSRTFVLLEAHAATSRIRDYLTETFAADRLWELFLYLSLVGQTSLALQLQQEASLFFQGLSRYLQADRNSPRLRETHPVPAHVLMNLLEDAGAALRDACQHLPNNSPTRAERLVRISALAFNLSGLLEICMSLTDHSRVVTLEPDDSDAVEIRSAPVQAAQALAPLFDARLVMALSDTLAVDGRLEPMCHTLGFPETTRTLIVPPVASELPRLLLVVPESMPEPTERAWPAAAAARCIEVMRLVEGLAVGYFASEHAITHLLDRAPRLGLTLTTLELTTLDALETGTLLRVGSPAQTALDNSQDSQTPEPLCCSVLDRLPFPPFNAPHLELLRERDPHWFQHHALMSAVLTFRQILQPLLCSRVRRAVLVVLDKRLLSRPYGRLFCDCLPGVTLSRSLQDIAPFLTGKDT